MFTRTPRRPLAAPPVDPRLLARFVGGLGIAGLGMTLMLRSELGAAPWEVLVGGLAGLGGVPTSLVRYGVVAALVVVVAILGTKLRPALVVTGFIGATWMALFDQLVPQVDGLALRSVAFAVGLVVMGVGVAVYLHARLGAGPHDALIDVAARISGMPLWQSRTMCESTALLVGVLLGGVFGLGTVVFALGLGPIIAVATTQLDRWLPLGADTVGSG